MFMAFSNPPSTSNARLQQGSKMSKPPWFQFIDLVRSWSEKTLSTDGFLFESSPWHTLNLGFNPSTSPHKLQWFQFLQRAAQVDEGNRKAAVDLFLSNFSQIWLFTEILAAGMSMLLNGGFYLITYFWIKHQISFPDLSPSPENYRVISRLYKPSALGALMLVTSYTHHVLYKLLSGVSWEFEPWPPSIQRLCMHLVSSYTFQIEGELCTA
jgi:hypothetical protein